MTILFAVLLGVALGALLTQRLYSLALIASARHSMEKLQSTLDGLEAAHAIRLAALHHQTELASQIDVLRNCDERQSE